MSECQQCALINVSEVTTAKMDLKREPFGGPSSRLWRLMDQVLCLILLLVSTPILLTVALLVRVVDGTPIIFRQVRVGRFGEPFEVLKFRTMQVGFQDRFGVTTREDHRITSLGRFLRASRLDELPQLINVLLGEMSLVGPRPDVPHVIQLLPSENLRVLDFRPGVTSSTTLLFSSESVLFEEPGQKSFYLEVVAPMKAKMSIDEFKNANIGDYFGTLLKTLMPGRDRRSRQALSELLDGYGFDYE